MADARAALIFDCDGTLADTMPAHYRAWLDILRPHGIPFPEDRFYSLGGTPTVEIARMLFTGVSKGVDDQALREITRLKEQAFIDQIGQVLPIEKVVRVAREARQAGNAGNVTPMAVASGGMRRVVEMTLRQVGLLDWFSVIVAAEDTSRHKPEPDVFLEAARRLAVPPAICTVYEDTDLGIEAARRAGMRWIDVRVL